MIFEHLKHMGNLARSSTELLESCGWDEEELEALMQRLVPFLQELADLSKDSSELTPEQQRLFVNNLRVGLLNIARDDQIDIIVKFIGDSVGVALHSEVD